jgi:RND family efflux transporter MFP subunit
MRLARFLSAVTAIAASSLLSLSANDGLVKPFQETTLSAQILGRIAEIPVEEGDLVSVGDMVLRMDDRIEQLEVNRRALVRDDQSELELATKRAAVLGEEAVALRALYEESGGVSREELNQKELEAALAAAEKRKVTNREELEVIEVQMAEEQLGQRHIRAPFSGYVVEILMEEGEVCREGQPVARMVDIDQCYLECYLDGSAGISYKAGQKVWILVPGLDGKLIRRQGTVDYVAPIVDAASGLRKVDVLFDNTDRTVLPGLPGRLVGPVDAES